MPLAAPRYTIADLDRFPDDGHRYELLGGVREVWRVDLRDRTIFVSRQGGPVDEPHAGRLVWHPAEMPQPLELDLRSVFP